MSENKTPTRGYKGSTKAEKKTATKRAPVKKVSKKSSARVTSSPKEIVEVHSTFLQESLKLIFDVKKNIDKESKAKIDEKSLNNVQKHINTFLRKNRLQEFGKVGETYNPSNHEALLFVKTDDAKVNKLLEIRSMGIKSGRKVIVRCKAIISK